MEPNEVFALTEKDKDKINAMVQSSVQAMTDVEKAFIIYASVDCMFKISPLMNPGGPDINVHLINESVRVAIAQAYMTGKAVGKGELEV